MEDRRVQQLVERTFITIGEAVRRLDHHDPVALGRITAHRQIVNVRSLLIHSYGYDLIDDPTVWHAVQEALPTLRAEVETLLREADPPPDDPPPAPVG